jgi:hypothetical protein
MRSLVAIVVVTMIARTAAADSSPAEQAFDKGRQLMQTRRYAAACAAFELSQRLDPQLGTQFNLAGCYVELKKLTTAWKLYRELARSDGNEARRTRSAQVAKVLEGRLSKILIQLGPADQTPRGLKVRVGTTDVTALIGTAIPFDAGHYAVVATVPGRHAFRREIDVEDEGTVATVEVVVERDREGEVAAAPGADRARSGQIALASGAGLVAIGLVAGGRALANRDASRALCNAMVCSDREGAQARTDRARIWGDVATVAVIAGVIGVAGGIYLWRTARSATVGVGVVPGTATVVLTGAF